ncbi:VOC family protein [Nocardia camponoti]|uniref:Lyase n=1 Tax=Nocardia camponoti TaxID=1616106 RepID=A0A917QTF0_9NOCA|nr:VOC family protein [Nocardia camponoti]GGK67415.1 lyase [Nocardia camponoti]
MSHGDDLALTHVALLIGDQDEALTFYRDLIGLQVRSDIPFADDQRWLTVGPVDQPHLEILLETPGMSPDPVNQTARQARLDSGAQGTLIFDTNDLDGTFTRIKDAGATVAQPIVEQPYGRDCAFTDPWGNQLRFHARQHHHG